MLITQIEPKIPIVRPKLFESSQLVIAMAIDNTTMTNNVSSIALPNLFQFILVRVSLNILTISCVA